MAKMAKKKQTDYTKAGKAISDTAVPLYQENLGRIGEYLDNPQARIDDYLQKYYTNTSKENDFLRNYNRAMSNQTASNYGATHGGYSSANQMSYDDLQRSMNDEAARLRDYGITSSANLANMDYQNMLNGNATFHNAYGLGKEYSDIDQYNYLAHQNNKLGNQVMGSMGTIGTAIGSIWGPAGAMLGNAIGSGIGGAFSTDVSSALGQVQGQGVGSSGIQATNLTPQQLTNLATYLPTLFGKKNTNNNKNNTNDSSSNNAQSSGWGLNTTQPTSGYKFSWQK